MELVSDRRYHVDAAPDAVWSALLATDQYQGGGRGCVSSTRQGWRPATSGAVACRPPLPYTVRFTIVLEDVEPPRTVGARIEGDITGTARVDLAEERGGCEIRLTSALSPRGRAVRIMADLARPLARRGHDWVLDTGARQFAASVQRSSGWKDGGRG